MSCSYDTSKDITWIIIPADKQDEKCAKSGINIIDALFKPVECAGKFYLDIEPDKQKCKSDKRCDPISGQIIRTASVTPGSTSSVKAEHGLCNFHTHPLICYKGMEAQSESDKCIWGWPSGEDMREAICFMLKGNVIHLVFALEGVYSMQVNPNYLKTLKSLTDADRGYIISIIENYFKATHGFRNKINNRGKNVCRPEHWIKFANMFTLDNLLSNKNKCSPKLPCNGVPDAEDGSSSLSEYFEQFGMEKYECSMSGHITTKDGEIKYNSEKLKRLIDKFKHETHHIKLGPEWKQGRWFNVQFSPNLCDGKRIDRLTKTWNAERIYNMWLDIGKQHNKLSFSRIPIKFHTYAITNKNKCRLSHKTHPGSTSKSKSKRTSNSFGKKSRSKKSGKRVQAFGRNHFKR